MKICTFNVQNDYKDYKKDKSNEIFNFIKNNKIDVIGMQEVFNKLDKDLNILFSNKYNMEGKYRFISKLLLRSINEKNPIVTNHNIISTKTYHLPFFPSFTKRVLTNVVMDYNGIEISIYNTHLEVDIDKVKIKQLNKIYDVISNDKRPVILMGDFNLKTNNDIFNNFVSRLEEIGIKRIPLDEKTFKPSKYSREIDHIFISKEFKLKNKKVIKKLMISDHYPVEIEVEIK